MTKKQESPNGRVYIEYWPLSKLPPAERNPKLHDIEEIALSLRRFGVANIVAAVDERTGRMYVGHGRKEALLLYKERVEGGTEGWEAPPLRVEAREGDWHVPVLRGVAFKDDVEAQAYLLADNRLTELGSWNEVDLAAILSQQSDFNGLGWSTDAVASLQAFASMVSPDHTSFALESLNFEPPPIEPRLIVRCKNTAEVKRLQAHLGIDPVDTDRVLFNYSDTLLAKRKKKS